MDYKETVLLVDDESTLRSVFADLLSGHGYRCIAAANAVDALQIIEANLFKLDLLVTDIMMPGELNGLDLANKVRERQGDVAILLISGYAQSALVKEAEARGYRLLEKPFRHFQLEAAITEELAKGRARKDGASEGDGADIISIDKARERGQR